MFYKKFYYNTPPWHKFYLDPNKFIKVKAKQNTLKAKSV